MVDLAKLVVIQYYKEFDLMIYNPAKDRSKEFGWKNVCDEHVPTEKEQDFWGALSIIVVLILSAITLIGERYGIF
jgi:hypothetical protein